MEPTNQEEKQSVGGIEGPQGEKRLSQVIEIPTVDRTPSKSGIALSY